jgi:Rrf2 family nitric oxide-sensitive transcriptional repressor
MRLTLHTDYALRVLMLLAASEERATIGAIADRYGISRNHLMKVVQRLVQLELVRSDRGRGGGLRLARPAEEIGIGAVVRALEETGTFVECFDAGSNRCRAAPACGLRGVLAGALDAFMAHLDGVTLADVMADAPHFAAALGLPPVPPLPSAAASR